jgi:hypothetical protein
MVEEWKDIEDYEGIYQISNIGRCKSLGRTIEAVNGVIYRYKTIILKQQTCKQGYKKVTLGTYKRKKSFLVHRLVANAFIDNPENKPQINHKNCIKGNNNIENLEWSLCVDNIRHAFKNELHYRKGEFNGKSKLNEHQVMEIYTLAQRGDTQQSEIGKLYKVSSETVSAIKNKRSWKHIHE